MNGWTWFGVLLVLAIIAATVLICIYFHTGSKHRSSCHTGGKSRWVHAVQSGVMTITASATGASTGAVAQTGLVQTGFLDVVSATILTCKDSNAIMAAVSAETAIVTTDVEQNSDDVPATQVSIEVGQIEMRVLVDGVALAPAVTFNGIVHILDNTVDPDHLQFYLDAASIANTFNWIASTVTHGFHTVTVQARLTAAAAVTGALFAQATAQLQNTSLILHSVAL